jgi:hypothetical protein
MSRMRLCGQMGKTEKSEATAKKIQSTGFVIWIISALYLLPMGWLLLSALAGYGVHETKPWLVSAVVALTISYGILMLLLWPHETERRTRGDIKTG